MTAESGLRSGRRLTSWKEIAQHFGRTVRTVQGWEKTEGLPVHRHLHRRQSSVYAYPEELDAWWQQRQVLPPPRRSGPTAGRRARVLLLVGATVALAGTLLVWQILPGQITREAPPSVRTITFDGTRPGLLLRGLVGDLNGDGRGDLVLSASGARQIYIVFGGASMQGGTLPPAEPGVIITAPARGIVGVTQVGDFNADTIADLVIVRQLEEPESYRETGPAYIVWGRRDWSRDMVVPGSADVTLRLDWPTDARLGGCWNVGSRPDVNGDGTEDVLLAAPEYGPAGLKSAGSVFVLYGRTTWPRDLEVATSAGLRIDGSQAGEGLGRTCAPGDFNGDGATDLAVFASEATLFNLLGGRGSHYLFLGSRALPAVLATDLNAALRVRGVGPTLDGVAASALADVNGDGRDDLVLGWPALQETPDDPGEVHIRLGRVSVDEAGSAGPPDAVITGRSPGALLGHALAAHDVDGDGFLDLIVAEPGRGAISLLYGRRAWKPSGRLEEYAPLEVFHGVDGAGSYQIAVGDVDGDSLPEILFTAPDVRTRAGTVADRAWVVSPYVHLRVDVRPDMEPNVIHLPDWIGVVRVYGSSSTQADPVDPLTVRFAGAAPARHVSTDYDRDGFADLQLYFDTAAMTLPPGSRRIAITGRTRRGLPVGGSDSIVVVPLAAGPSARPQPRKAVSPDRE